MSTCHRPFFSCRVWMALLYFPQLVPGLLPASQHFSTGLLLTAMRPGGNCLRFPFLHCCMVPGFRTLDYRLCGANMKLLLGDQLGPGTENRFRDMLPLCQPGPCSLAQARHSKSWALVSSFAKTSGLRAPCTQGFLFLTVFYVTLPWVL